MSRELPLSAIRSSGSSDPRNVPRYPRPASSGSAVQIRRACAASHSSAQHHSTSRLPPRGWHARRAGSHVASIRWKGRHIGRRNGRASAMLLICPATVAHSFKSRRRHPRSQQAPIRRRCSRPMRGRGTSNVSRSVSRMVPHAVLRHWYTASAAALVALYPRCPTVQKNDFRRALSDSHRHSATSSTRSHASSTYIKQLPGSVPFHDGAANGMTLCAVTVGHMHASPHSAGNSRCPKVPVRYRSTSPTAATAERRPLLRGGGVAAACANFACAAATARSMAALTLGSVAFPASSSADGTSTSSTGSPASVAKSSTSRASVLRCGKAPSTSCFAQRTRIPG